MFSFSQFKVIQKDGCFWQIVLPIHLSPPFIQNVWLPGRGVAAFQPYDINMIVIYGCDLCNGRLRPLIAVDSKQLARIEAWQVPDMVDLNLAAPVRSNVDLWKEWNCWLTKLEHPLLT